MAVKEQFGPDTVLYDDGTLVRDKGVSVFVTGTNTLAQLYTSILGTTTAANPVLTDAYGNLTFYVDPGVYELELNGYRVPVVIEDSSASGGTGTVFVQSTPVAQVVVPHLLGRMPDVAVFVAGEQVLTDVTATAAQVTITFPSPTAFTAVIH
jgi:hypothetical protein